MSTPLPLLTDDVLDEIWEKTTMIEEAMYIKSKGDMTDYISDAAQKVVVLENERGRLNEAFQRGEIPAPLQDVSVDPVAWLVSTAKIAFASPVEMDMPFDVKKQREAVRDQINALIITIERFKQLHSQLETKAKTEADAQAQEAPHAPEVPPMAAVAQDAAAAAAAQAETESETETQSNQESKPESEPKPKTLRAKRAHKDDTVSEADQEVQDGAGSSTADIKVKRARTKKNMVRFEDACDKICNDERLTLVDRMKMVSSLAHKNRSRLGSEITDKLMFVSVDLVKMVPKCGNAVNRMRGRLVDLFLRIADRMEDMLGHMATVGQHQPLLNLLRAAALYSSLRDTSVEM